MNNVHPIFAPILAAIDPAPKLDAMGYQQRVRVGNMNRDRITREIAEDPNGTSSFTPFNARLDRKLFKGIRPPSAAGS